MHVLLFFFKLFPQSTARQVVAMALSISKLAPVFVILTGLDLIVVCLQLLVQIFRILA